jgi:dienelactone hydrolase
LLANREPERVIDLWARLDPKIRHTLNNLSPHTKIDKLKTKIAIIHTFTDDVIPWVESCKLANAIEDSHKVYFRVFEQFYHVSIEDLLKARISNLHNVISEAVQLYLYMYSILYRL